MTTPDYRVRPWPRNRVIAWWWRHVLGRRSLGGASWVDHRARHVHLFD